MKLMQIISAALMASVLLITLPGCDSQDGPMEKAGESIDSAAEKVGEKLEDTGESVKDTAQGNN